MFGFNGASLQSSRCVSTFQAGNTSFFTSRQNGLFWKICAAFTLWPLWIERKRIIFENKQDSWSRVFDTMIFSAPLWANQLTATLYLNYVGTGKCWSVWVVVFIVYSLLLLFDCPSHMFTL